jgi:hypothetical protein
MRKRAREECLAASLRRAGLRCQPPAWAKVRIGKKIDILNIDDHSIDNCGRRLGAGELVGDNVANKVTQRRRPAIMAVGSQKAGAAQARDRHGVEQTVVGLCIEQSPVVIKFPGLVDKPGT